MSNNADLRKIADEARKQVAILDAVTAAGERLLRLGHGFYISPRKALAATTGAAAGAAASVILLTGGLVLVATPFIAIASAGLLAMIVPDTEEERLRRQLNDLEHRLLNTNDPQLVHALQDRYTALLAAAPTYSRVLPQSSAPPTIPMVTPSPTIPTAALQKALPPGAT